MASDKVLELSDAEFGPALEAATTPMLVDFWAEWCGPCRRIAPLVERLAEAFAGRLAVCKIDVDQNNEVAGRYGVQSIPTLMIFKDGQPVERIVGTKTPEELTEIIERVLE